VQLPNFSSLGDVGMFLAGAAGMAAVIAWVVKTFKNGKRNGNDGLEAERRTNAAVKEIMQRMDANQKELMDNLDGTRHDLRNTIHEHTWGRKRPSE
jgi:hypothetical protein